MSTKKIFWAFSLALLICVFCFSSVYAISREATLSGNTGGVSYTGRKYVGMLPNSFSGSVTSSSTSSMGRIGITYWTFQMQCTDGTNPIYITSGAALNYNSSYYHRYEWKPGSVACGNNGTTLQFIRSTGNHEFNMGTPVYRFLEARYP